MTVRQLSINYYSQIGHEFCIYHVSETVCCINILEGKFNKWAAIPLNYKMHEDSRHIFLEESTFYKSMALLTA
jgi:hypothetical protein